MQWPQPSMVPASGTAASRAALAIHLRVTTVTLDTERTRFLPSSATSGHGSERWRRRLTRRLVGRFDWSSVHVRLMLVAAAAVLPLALLAAALAAVEASQTGSAGVRAAWFSLAVATPLLAILVCLTVALAADAWILRWVDYFERVARAYGRGRYTLRSTRLQDAPAEFRSLGAAVNDMAAAVQQRDRALRTALDEQTMLLREVHHRVKNNLQIVSSLLSLQASRSGDTAVKEALTDALVRLDAMGLAQRFLQDDEEHGSISARQLFEAFVQQLRARLGPAGRRLALGLQVQDRQLSLDVAAPLVLIAGEAVMQAFRHYEGEAPLRCRLEIDGCEPQRVELALTVENDGEAFEPGEGISRSLIEGYVRQIKGKLSIGMRPARLTVEAPLPLAA
jgi:two-component sensor histidine kinase